MRLEYIGLSELSGSLIALEGVKNVAFDEMAEVTLESGERRYGRVILIDGDRVVLQVFEGTRGISLENASTHFTGKSMDIALSKEMLGRVFDGAGRPIDALGEISSSKGEIPSRKGFPAYLYSDLASLYERAGMIHGRTGSVTQVPVLTMPNDDITHPIPDLTGYITEGQIVLDRELDQKGIYPPIAILPSLSRLMKDGVGKGFTRDDHYDVSNQLFASYSKVQDARSLASVIGEDELSELDKQYLAFGDAFERRFVHQSLVDNRTIAETLDLGWKLLTMLPRGELDRVDAKTIEAHYVEGAWKELFERKQS